MISQEELLRIMPYAKARVETFLSPLNETMYEYDIVTPLRIAAFLAQLAHESGELRYVEELASGKAYDTRTDLGNTPEVDGDGEFYKGRGLIQVTGKHNYEQCSYALFDDDRLLTNPHLLCQPRWAVQSAGWFWDLRKLNQLADVSDFQGITKRVNGGLNGYKDRLAYYNRALLVLGEHHES